MGTSLLVLRLEGPMQAWGREAHWDQRGTHPMPTKSAIAGMIACAMGVERGDERVVDIANSFTMGVRADRPGAYMQDFHTVTGNPLMTADGKPKARSSGNTIVSRREYLQDASFLVVLEAPVDTLKKYQAALMAPKWPVYLGRRSCVPSRPVLETLTDQYTDIPHALHDYPLAERRSKDRPILCEIDAGDSEEWVMTRNDVPQSAQDRTFAIRRLGRLEVDNVSDAARSAD